MHKFVLNEAPNNNNITRIANIQLNKMSNSNDATCPEIMRALLPYKHNGSQ